MTGFDANEHLTPFRDARGYGAILFDRTQLRQPDPAWFAPAHWGEAAQPVAEGGRGGAWFIETGLVFLWIFGLKIPRSRGGAAVWAD